MPDLVIMDITALNVEGTGVLIQIQKYTKNANVFMCTASDQNAHQESPEGVPIMVMKLDTSYKAVKRVNFLTKTT